MSSNGGRMPLGRIAAGAALLVLGLLTLPVMELTAVFVLPVALLAWVGGASWGVVLAFALPVLSEHFAMASVPVAPLAELAKTVLRILFLCAVSLLVARAAPGQPGRPGKRAAGPSGPPSERAVHRGP